MKISFVVFSIDGSKYALHLKKVERVIPAIELSPLPNAPGIILGAVNIEGRIIPVVNLRKRLSLQSKEIEPEDKYILASTQKRTFILIADDVEGVVDYDDKDMVDGKTVLPDLPNVEGILAMEDGMVIIHDVDKFLSLEEETELDSALC